MRFLSQRAKRGVDARAGARAGDAARVHVRPLRGLCGELGAWHRASSVSRGRAAGPAERARRRRTRPRRRRARRRSARRSTAAPSGGRRRRRSRSARARTPPGRRSPTSAAARGWQGVRARRHPGPGRGASVWRARAGRRQVGDRVAVAHRDQRGGVDPAQEEVGVERERNARADHVQPRAPRSRIDASSSNSAPLASISIMCTYWWNEPRGNAGVADAPHQPDLLGCRGARPRSGSRP